MIVKAISLLQPWAHLVVIGAKKWETRGWKTEHRGRVLIHASLSEDHMGLLTLDPFKKYNGHPGSIFTRGAIIGECMIQEIVRTEVQRGVISKEEFAFGDWKTGRWAWKLVNPIQYKKPYFVKGSLSLWDFDDSLLKGFK